MEIIFDKNGAKHAIALFLSVAGFGIGSILCLAYLSSTACSIIAGVIVIISILLNFFTIKEGNEDKNKKKQILKDWYLVYYF